MELSFLDARACVLAEVARAGRTTGTETVHLLDANGRWLAADVYADRDYPPFPRSMRDGYAVHSSDWGERDEAVLHRIGEVRAGEEFTADLKRGDCVEIMTGAPVPEGADAVVMVEFTRREGDRVSLQRKPQPGDNIAPRGSEARAGDVVASRGMRLDYAAIAVLASVGCLHPQVAKRPRVAILSTGDELVDPATSPRRFQIRNSNAWSLAVQVNAGGGEALIMPAVRDELQPTRDAITEGLAKADMLLISGGVSAGKFDLVESAITALGGQAYFDAVRIRPGRPAVFGRISDKLVFALPGNPLATMINFELLVAPAIALLSGAQSPHRPLMTATMGFTYSAKPMPLTMFIPVQLSGDYIRATTQILPYHGSADVVAAARANAFLVIPEGCGSILEGETAQLLLK